MREQTQHITNKPFRQRVSKTEFSVNDTPTAIGNIVNATVKLVLVFRSHHCLSVEFPVSIRCYDHTPLFTVIQHTFGFIFFLYTLFSLFFFLLFFRNLFSFSPSSVGCCCCVILPPPHATRRSPQTPSRRSRDYR